MYPGLQILRMKRFFVIQFIFSRRKKKIEFQLQRKICVTAAAREGNSSLRAPKDRHIIRENSGTYVRQRGLWLNA